MAQVRVGHRSSVCFWIDALAGRHKRLQVKAAAVATYQRWVKGDVFGDTNRTTFACTWQVTLLRQLPAAPLLHVLCLGDAHIHPLWPIALSLDAATTAMPVILIRVEAGIS